MAPTTSDFKKRPKAKVGKRAPAKVNATDTSFKTSSVAVRSQDQSLQKGKYITKQQSQDASASTSAVAVSFELASSRGNTLSTLQISLRHHAPAVRASGLKGIRDAVQSLSLLEATLGTTILEANLPSLLPNMCRCWLDEDDDVRSLAIKLFGDIISTLSTSSEQSDLKCLAPFVPILGAYASSALNSLDRSIRKDGALIVGILASSDPSPSYVSISSSTIEDRKLPAMAAEMGKHMYSFIPPLERLLVSMSFGGRENSTEGSKEGGSKKRRRDETKNNQSAGSLMTAKDSVLLSVALLLRASWLAEKNVVSQQSNGGSNSCRLAPSLTVSGECTFLSGGSAQTNSIFLFREGNSGINDSISPIRNIFDLPSMPNDEMIGDENGNHAQEYSSVGHASSSQKDTSLSEKIQVLNSLLETLRVKFVELTHSGRKPSNDKDGLLLSTSDLDMVDSLVRTMRFIHQHFIIYKSNAIAQHLPIISTDGNQKRQAKKRGRNAIPETQDIAQCIVTYQTTVQKTLSLLLEVFPIFPMDGKSTTRYELTNAGICSALAELGGGEGRLPADSTHSSYQWINAVFSYLLPRLDSTRQEDDSTKDVATDMLLNVLEKLLLPHNLHCGSDFHEFVPSYLLNSPLKRHELLEAFAEAFFPHFAYPSTAPNAIEQRICALASTAVGKTAAMLLVTMITQTGDLSKSSIDVDVQLHEKRTALLLQMSSVLPLYLKSWEGRLPTETGRVLSALIALVRQWSLDSNRTVVEDVSIQPVTRSMNDLCLGLRCSLDALYIAHKKSPSIFETLPVKVQKLAIGLIGILGCPSEALTRSLSKICSKSVNRHEVLNVGPGDACISSDLATYIMEVIYSLRKALPMPSYLTFLIDCSGIHHATGALAMRNQNLVKDRVGSTTISRTDAVFFHDRSIEQLCRFLTTSCDQSSTKVLPMILPILQIWLSPSIQATDGIVRQLVQPRAATSIIAAFAWDDALSFGVSCDNVNVVPPEFLSLDTAFGELLVDSIVRQVEYSARIWSIDDDGFMSDPIEQFLARLLGPVTILLRYCRGMLEKFVARVTLQIVTESKESTASECSGSNVPVAREDVSSNKINTSEVLTKTLLLILKSKYPASIADLVRSCTGLSDTWLSAAVDIEKAVARGHLAHLGSKLLHQVKVLKR